MRAYTRGMNPTQTDIRTRNCLHLQGPTSESPDATLVEPVLPAHRCAAHALERVGEVARESERPIDAQAHADALR